MEATPKTHQQEWMNKRTNSHNGTVYKTELTIVTQTLSVYILRCYEQLPCECHSFFQTSSPRRLGRMV